MGIKTLLRGATSARQFSFTGIHMHLLTVPVYALVQKAWMVEPALKNRVQNNTRERSGKDYKSPDYFVVCNQADRSVFDMIWPPIKYELMYMEQQYWIALHL